MSLNAPFGARCFLTLSKLWPGTDIFIEPNAPFGARCFPTGNNEQGQEDSAEVLMHLLALGAF